MRSSCTSPASSLRSRSLRGRRPPHAGDQNDDLFRNCGALAPPEPAASIVQIALLLRQLQNPSLKDVLGGADGVNGRTADSDSVNPGSNPVPPATNPPRYGRVFSVSVVAGKVLILSPYSVPANASVPPETPNVRVRGPHGRGVSRGHFRVVGCGAFGFASFDNDSIWRAMDRTIACPLQRGGS